MRLRTFAVAAVATAAVAAGTVAVVNSSGNSGSGNGTSASTGQHTTLNVTLPDWSTDAPGAYKGEIKMPAEAKVIETLTGDNAGRPIDDPTVYKPKNSGNGMQVRFACTNTLLPDGVYYFSPKVGNLKDNGEPDGYEDTPSDQTSGSFFFNWDWLSNKIGQPGSKGFIDVYGNCKWEIRLLSFPPQPLPGS